MDIKKISIKNFRVFKEKTTFELRPFTILTGPNNSGKSSFIKFLLLIKVGVDKLNFTQGNHNLENYQSILNYESQDESLNYEILTNNDINVSYFFTELENLDKVNVLEDNKAIFSCKRELGVYDNSDSFETDNLGTIFSMKFDIGYFIKSWQNYNNDLYSLEYNDEMYSEEIIWLKGLLFEIYDNDNNVTLEYINEIKQLQNDVFERYIELPYHYYEESFFGLIDKEIQRLISNCIKEFSDNFHDLLGSKEKEFKINLSYFGRSLLKSGLALDFNNWGSNNLSSWVLSIINGTSFGASINYLSPERGSQKRVLFNESEKDIDSIIVAFTKRKNIQNIFLTECFSKLGIEGKLKINRYENTISTVKMVLPNGKEVSLADLGFGYSQVIPIILKVHNLLPDIDTDITKKSRRTQNLYREDFGNLILEEPEANLHPNLQSKLAELLVYIRSVINIKFIIETHSEYFIRKLQYLTAKNELKTEDSVIYYFNDDKYVSKTEPKVKEIFINKDGGLTDSFGPGFFDEATKLQFDLIRLQKQQFN